MASQTLRPGEAWIARTDGPAHLQSRSGRGRTACGERAIEERYHTPGRPRCERCLDTAGVVVAAPTEAWTEGELREAYGR